MKIICINGEWYVYVAGPFSTREHAEFYVTTPDPCSCGHVEGNYPCEVGTMGEGCGG